MSSLMREIIIYKVYSLYHYTGKYNFRFSFSDVACYLKQVDGGDWYYYVDDKKDTSKTGLFSIRILAGGM